jgi:molybdopterin-guanine dinucleotide biosynthesis protein A
VLPRSARGLEPLCALYDREAVLPRARARLAGSSLALRGLLDELRMRTLEGSDLRAVDPEDTALTNANTPEEWAQARERLEGAAG